MKRAIFTAILVASLSSPAFAGIATPPDADEMTDARANVVEACFGACEKDNNQLNLTTSPYEVDLKYNEIMKVRAKPIPNQMDDGKATKEKSWDI